MRFLEAYARLIVQGQGQTALATPSQSHNLGQTKLLEWAGTEDLVTLLCLLLSPQVGIW